MLRVLLVEDDALLGDGVCTGLKQYGYTVDWVQDGLSAQHALLNEQFGAVVLDLGLPKRSGLEVLKSIRAQHITVPVLILTARESSDDKVKGLDAGADDYLIKPFDLDELCARLRALQRRTASRATAVITYGQISIDPSAYSVSIHNEHIPLSRREFTLLQKLLENVGKVISRDSLTQTLYGWGDDVDSNALEVHIHNLRKKFGDSLPIRTIRGVGYMVENKK